MTERLLQFIWQFQYFNRSDLRTEQGEPLQIIHPGSWNAHQGPDFSEARIRVGNTTWAGNIELHLLSSDWLRHFHHTDPNYKNIILHVVWKNNENEAGKAPRGIPCLELESRVSGLLLARYGQLMNSVQFVACENTLQQVSKLTWTAWKERLLVQRLQRKSKNILTMFEQSNHHWDETFWWLLARNFGIRVNAEAFEAIARSLPVNILTRHKSQPHQIEALLFGQAGLLETKFKEAYPQLLQKEYRFLRKKYQLGKVFVALQFLRMRPSSFPTVRLAQLATLIAHTTHLFSIVRENKAVNDLKKLLDVRAGDYWNTHYSFEEKSIYKKKHVGKGMGETVIINAIVPVLFAYGLYQGEQELRERAVSWLEDIAPEKNSITKGWEASGVSNRYAWDSQALIELKGQYCDCRRCLDCAIGNALLKVK